MTQLRRWAASLRYRRSSTRQHHLAIHNASYRRETRHQSKLPELLQHAPFAFVAILTELELANISRDFSDLKANPELVHELLEEDDTQHQNHASIRAVQQRLLS